MVIRRWLYVGRHRKVCPHNCRSRTAVTVVQVIVSVANVAIRMWPHLGE